MGSLREKVNKEGKVVAWEARVARRGYPAMSKSFPPNKKRVAEAWIASTETAMRGGDVVSRKPETTTIPVAINEFLLAHPELSDEAEEKLRKALGAKASKRIVSGPQRYALGQVSRIFSKFTVKTLSKDELEAAMDALMTVHKIPKPANRKKAHPLYDGDRERNYSPSTVRKYFYALKRVLEWHGKKNGYDVAHIFDEASPPEAWAEPRERRFEEGEEERLLEACDTKLKSPEGWRQVILLALETCCREQELLRMEWSWLNEELRFFAIPKRWDKNKTGRQVPLSRKALAVFAELKKLRSKTDPRVFHMLPVSAAVFGKGIRALVVQAGMKDFHFHDLRHEAISRLFERTTLRTLEIAKITGHKDLKTLERYANLRAKNQAEKLDAEISQIANALD